MKERIYIQWETKSGNPAYIEVTRWQKHGHDRLYINCYENKKYGYYDLKSRTFGGKDFTHTSSEWERTLKEAVLEYVKEKGL